VAIDEDRAAEGLRWAFDLFEAAEEMLETRLRREHPEASDAQIDEWIGAWLAKRPGAELGDADGLPRAVEP
jgi:hypothetical protein